MLQENFRSLVAAVLSACHAYYADRLISLAVFGSVARGTMRADSDIDLLLVVDPLPDGRMARVQEFESVEAAVAPALAAASAAGIRTTLSPVFKTPAELARGSLLFLDLTDQADILFDRDQILADYLNTLGQRLRALGAQRIYKGGGYYWMLKPDLQPGEEIRL